MACGSTDLFPAFFVSYNQHVRFLSTFEEPGIDFCLGFDEYVVANHSDSSCKLQSCKFHILLYDCNHSKLRPENINLIDFFYQQVGKVPSAIFMFLSGYLKKAKTSDLTLKNG